jgi:hypothetical protein
MKKRIKAKRHDGRRKMTCCKKVKNIIFEGGGDKYSFWTEM